MIIGSDQLRHIYLPAHTVIKRGHRGNRTLDFYRIVAARRHRSHGRWSDWRFEDAIDGVCHVDAHEPGIEIVAEVAGGKAPLQSIVRKERLTPARHHQWRLFLACGHTKDRGEPLPKKVRCEACLVQSK